MATVALERSINERKVPVGEQVQNLGVTDESIRLLTV